MCFVTNSNHAHLSESTKNDARISITCMGFWAFCDYALGRTHTMHNLRTRAIARNIHAAGVGLTWTSTINIGSHVSLARDLCFKSQGP